MNLVTDYAKEFNNRINGMDVFTQREHIMRKLVELNELWELAEDLGNNTETIALAQRDLQEMKSSIVAKCWAKS